MTNASSPPPYAKLTTLLVDAGNTLISMDFAWIRAELARCGIEVQVVDVERAEAAARPGIDAAFAAGGGYSESEGQSLFSLRLRAMLEQLELRVGPFTLPRSELTARLVPVLHTPGELSRLWSNVLPGVPNALEKLRAMGLRLAVVSNSDGTCESILIEHGLRAFFDAVVDSTEVGFEKPDPRIFQRALEILGANPAQTLHAGDSYHADVEGARAAGVSALLIDPFDDWEGVDCPRVTAIPQLAAKIAAARQAR